jgi:hypothetical protein
MTTTKEVTYALLIFRVQKAKLDKGIDKATKRGKSGVQLWVGNHIGKNYNLLQ